MKRIWWVSAPSLVGILLAGTAMAQGTMSPAVKQPIPISQTGYQADDYGDHNIADPAPAGVAVNIASPSDLPPAPPATSPPAPPVSSTTAPATPPVASPAEAAGQKSVVPPAAAEAAAPAADAPVPHAGEPALRRFWNVEWDAWTKKGYDDSGPEPERRCNPPAPWSSPPYPGTEWQGYPLIGLPQSPPSGVMQTWLNGGAYGDWFKKNNIGVDGWMTASYNWSDATFSNSPTSYFLVPNHIELDQLVFRVQKTYDTVQTDHIDWGFRSVALFGIDYRYMVAGGWEPASSELLTENDLYGLDFTEQYMEVYIPWVGNGMIIRAGRWIACPDIEVQYSPDNYLASHSILFTYDTYTQTGVMFTFKINRSLMVQGAIESGTDMAPWYQGAVATGFAGLRWVGDDNNDAFYTCLNNINSADFRHLTSSSGLNTGHDNYNYIVSTYEHKFNENVHTATEAYFMWQYDAVLGGTPSTGPVQTFGGGGGLTPGNANFVNGVNTGGSYLPGLSRAYGFLNYTEFGMAGTNLGEWAKNDYICIRNEWWKDDRGMRSGIPGNYTSDTIGYCHNFNAALQVRPEFGFYRNWDNPAFDNGTRNNLNMFAVDFTYHW